MTYYEGEPYKRVIESRQWYSCDGDDCVRVANLDFLHGWQTSVPEGDYGHCLHYCPDHRREVQGE